ncbi:EF-hand domain-containing family member C2-like [Adelges cooleyi]|uniref:EF-hand domain-containing family member C2-like n=1 Tax=Adelges cooleyi TaxID=133065 RepID=UPI00217FCECE|nr:EF-hand domain-containing family member C2-like [Adelges cooleyi]
MVTPLDEKKEDRTVNPDMVQVMLTNGRDVTNKPAWMVFGKETLTFDGYFKVSANESQYNYNVRKCKIVYFPEDNTITVMEPAIPNSGMTQGCLIRRHRIPHPGRANGFYELLDFNIGKTVEFYGKVFRITGVDCYTRDVLRKMGLDVPENQTQPRDPYFEYRAKTGLESNAETTSGKSKKYKDVDLEGKVLSFKAYWDDRQSAEGLLHFMEVHYFLLDDTMAIMEMGEDDKMTMFLQRQRIPKVFSMYSYNIDRPFHSVA